MADLRISVSIDQDGAIVVYARTRSGKLLYATGRHGFDRVVTELVHDEDFHELSDMADELLAGIPQGHRIEIEDIDGRRVSVFDSLNRAVALDITDLDIVRGIFEELLEAAQSPRVPGTP